jgi:hypothetical protein
MTHEEEEVENITTDIRKQDFWKAYLDRKSPTYSNAFKSAVSVGYGEGYATTITGALWFKAKMRRKSLLNKAEHVLDKTLDMVVIDEKGKVDAALARVQNDSAKFIAKTLGKDDGYTERTETTGKDGNPIVFMPMELMKKYGMGEVKEEVEVLENIDEE